MLLSTVTITGFSLLLVGSSFRIFISVTKYRKSAIKFNNRKYSFINVVFENGYGSMRNLTL